MKKLLPILLLLTLLVLVFLFLRSNRSYKTSNPTMVWEQDTEVKISATDLFNAFINDEAGANEQYLNKVVEVEGVVSTVRKGQSSTSVLLRSNDPAYGVRCRLDRQPNGESPDFKVGQNIRFKCICNGYVQDVEMVQCKEK
jgi:hypothetical protein